ncbi:TM2 domain-containing protein 2 isoform X1 [Thunnus albacares]|uniref:TM2 domain-containing protein 2 isoform X1 n=1 Tax=Thunnus albacares TaxID=8236 RepID=UPI001CF62097|nr:TM2 domain-containing protein 2 isoform X1 [Thunnus albacares]
MISVSYILLCGQLLLLLTVILLQCLEGIHSQNSTTAETPATVPGEGATTLPSTKQPPVVVKDDISAESANNTEAYEYRPPSPVVLCSYLPEEFIYCQDPVDHAGNYSAYQEMGHGCVVWGGQTEREVNHTEVMCTALDDIECAGPRDFLRGDVPCINQHCSGWMKERPDGGGGGEVMGRNRPAGLLIRNRKVETVVGARGEMVRAMKSIIFLSFGCITSFMTVLPLVWFGHR